MEHRRTRRFTLHLPLSVVRSGVERITLAGHTKNISSTGVLFTTESEPSVTGSIEYVITLSQDDKQPINLRCVGKVVRLERAANGYHEGAPAYHVAATLERYEFVRPR
ncbi:MAG: PilZ domain-containing protein [Bryobacteraceae bacterium]